jgi:hypothetical protein
LEKWNKWKLDIEGLKNGNTNEINLFNTINKIIHNLIFNDLNKEIDI